MNIYTNMNATADVKNYAEYRQNIQFFDYVIVALYDTTNVGRTKPNPVPMSRSPVIMAVAKGLYNYVI